MSIESALRFSRTLVDPQPPVEWPRGIALLPFAPETSARAEGGLEPFDFNVRFRDDRSLSPLTVIEAQSGSCAWTALAFWFELIHAPRPR